MKQETRILITGANGFVGRHLIAHLLETEHALVSETNIDTAASGDRQQLISQTGSGSTAAKCDSLRIFAGVRAADLIQSGETPASQIGQDGLEALHKGTWRSSRSSLKIATA